MMKSMIRMRQPPDPAPGVIERIDQRPEYSAAIAELQKLENRLAETRARRERLAAALRLRGGGTSAAPTLTAEELVAGAAEPGYSAEGELAACDNEAMTLRRAVADQADKIAEIRGEVSLEICRQFSAANSANHRAVLAAMVTLRDAMRVTVGLHAALNAAGYQINEAAMPSHLPWGAYQVVNDAGRPDGEIGRLERFIAERLS